LVWKVKTGCRQDGIRRASNETDFVVVLIIINIIIIRNLYSAIMPLGGYRGTGGTGR